MNIPTGSTWLQSTGKQETYTSLKKDIKVDVAIIGGGLTGIATSYLLHKAGKSVAVLEKGTYEDSVTAYTTAFLTHVLDSDLQDLVSMYGEQQAKLLWQSHAEAIDQVEEIIKKEKIECDFMRCDDYSVAFSEKETELLEKEAAQAEKFGFPVSFTKKSNLGFANFGYMQVRNQAKFHPIKYLQSLKAICEKDGIQIYEKTEATDIQTNHNESTVLTKGGAIVTAQHVIIATYDPFNHPLQLFGRRGMYTSYVMEALIPAGKLSEGLYEDQANPYHYWRVDKMDSKQDRIIFGGEDHRHEIPMDKEKNYRALENFLQKLFPAEEYTITRRWDGPILEPSDGIASIGRLEKDKNIYVAMAFSGNGMTYAHIAAMLFRDMIMKKKNPWEDLYNPNRIPPLMAMWQKLNDYGGEFFGGAVKNIFS